MSRTVDNLWRLGFSVGLAGCGGTSVGKVENAPVAQVAPRPAETQIPPLSTGLEVKPTAAVAVDTGLAGEYSRVFMKRWTDGIGGTDLKATEEYSKTALEASKWAAWWANPNSSTGGAYLYPGTDRVRLVVGGEKWGLEIKDPGVPLDGALFLSPQATIPEKIEYAEAQNYRPHIITPYSTNQKGYEIDEDGDVYALDSNGRIAKFNREMTEASRWRFIAWDRIVTATATPEPPSPTAVPPTAAPKPTEAPKTTAAPKPTEAPKPAAASNSIEKSGLRIVESLQVGKVTFALDESVTKRPLARLTDLRMNPDFDTAKYGNPADNVNAFIDEVHRQAWIVRNRQISKEDFAKLMAEGKAQYSIQVKDGRGGIRTEKIDPASGVLFIATDIPGPYINAGSNFQSFYSSQGKLVITGLPDALFFNNFPNKDPFVLSKISGGTLVTLLSIGMTIVTMSDEQLTMKMSSDEFGLMVQANAGKLGAFRNKVQPIGTGSWLLTKVTLDH